MSTFNNNAILIQKTNTLGDSCLHSEKHVKCTHLASKNKRKCLVKKNSPGKKSSKMWRLVGRIERGQLMNISIVVIPQNTGPWEPPSAQT